MGEADSRCEEEAEGGEAGPMSPTHWYGPEGKYWLGIRLHGDRWCMITWELMGSSHTRMLDLRRKSQ
jgi:hypothetical protein